jgi:cytochrome c oxidase assembly factor CtaG
VLLTVVVAPLLVLGTPFWPLWRAFPRRVRRAVLSPLMRTPASRRWWHWLGNLLSHPAFAWIAFAGGFTVWHIPFLYDLALEQPTVHAIEHLTFLGTSALFWTQIIPSPPFATRLAYPLRALYTGAAAVQGNVIDALFMFSTTLFYPYYAQGARASWMPTPLEDQHIAGALMGTMTTILMSVVVVILLGLWLLEDERAGEQEQQAAERRAQERPLATLRDLPGGATGSELSLTGNGNG